MKTVTKGSVFDYIGFGSDESIALRVKADLLNEILKTIKKKKLKSTQLQKLFDVPQPRVSELVNGKISKVSIEKLLGYLEKLGKQPAPIKFKNVA